MKKHGMEAPGGHRLARLEELITEELRGLLRDDVTDPALDGVWINPPGNKPAVPLSAFARYEYTNTPLAVNHQGQFAAATVTFNLQKGYSLSQATAAIQQASAEIGMPTTIVGSLTLRVIGTLVGIS